MFRKKTPKEKVLAAYAKLQRTPSGSKHAERYLALKFSLNANLVYDIIFDEKVTWDDKAGIYNIYGDITKVTKSRNLHMVDLNNRLRARQTELSEGFAARLEWLLEVHGY